MLVEARLGIWKGLSRNGLFLLLYVWSLSWDNLEDLDEAVDGGRKRQKGLFTHVSGAWARRTRRLGLLVVVSPCGWLRALGLLSHVVAQGFKHRCYNEQG